MNVGTDRAARSGRSCAECRRRKIKCSKQIPCRACQERGDAAFCHRAPIAPPRRGPEPRNQNPDIDELKRELARVNRRLARLEASVNLNVDYEEGYQPTASTLKDNQVPTFQEGGLAGALEDAAFDIGQVRRWQERAQPGTSHSVQDNGAHWFSSIPFSLCLAALPSRRYCERLVEAFLAHLNWFCGFLHGPTLQRMHSAFWVQREQGVPQDTMFIALLFAVLSNAAYLLDDEDARETGLEPGRLRQLASVWFDCSYASFFRCNGLAEPSLLGVQAMVTLNYAFHLSGNTKMHNSMFSINVGTARSANLHLLGDQTSDPAQDVVQREMGRRAWWALVETEWFFCPYHRYTYIAPHHFDTPLPDLADDGMSISSRPNSLHPLSYFLATCRSARVLYDLYGTLPPHHNPSYEAVMAASDQLEGITFAFNALQVTEPAPKSFAHIKRIMGMALEYRLYLVHRAYFFNSLSDSKLWKTHQVCVAAAHKILDLADEGLPERFLRLWNVTIWLVAAGLVLALDLVMGASYQRPSQDIQNRHSRLSALTILLEEKADETGIGARGAKLISQVCRMEKDVSLGRKVTLGRLTPRDILNFAGRQDQGSRSATGVGRFPHGGTISPITDRIGPEAETQQQGLLAGLTDPDDLLFLSSPWIGQSMDYQLPFIFPNTSGTEPDQVLNLVPDINQGPMH
ncbi:Zn(II)2Cys6 transcription factor [Aspergillus lucknowensis]|uniref:Zn(2)-C6 fungal-type domain-containing protein n=1 Tax=Aspergillus lucknowensis TaxID=176173 RepID=A0ABR4LPV7_9EURO